MHFERVRWLGGGAGEITETRIREGLLEKGTISTSRSYRKGGLGTNGSTVMQKGLTVHGGIHRWTDTVSPYPPPPPGWGVVGHPFLESKAQAKTWGHH